MSLIVTGIVGAVGLGISGYEASVQNGIAGQAQGLAQAQWNSQLWYDKQLQSLVQNPGSWLTNPTFQAGLNQGLQGVQRTETAQGYGGSGNEAAALEQYGQSQALGSLFQQEQILGSVSGLQVNPATALGTASGAAATGAQIASGGLNAATFAALLGTGAFSGTGITGSDAAMLAAGGGTQQLIPGQGGYVYNNPASGPYGGP